MRRDSSVGWVACIAAALSLSAGAALAQYGGGARDHTWDPGTPNLGLGTSAPTIQPVAPTPVPVEPIPEPEPPKDVKNGKWHYDWLTTSTQAFRSYDTYWLHCYENGKHVPDNRCPPKPAAVLSCLIIDDGHGCCRTNEIPFGPKYYSHTPQTIFAMSYKRGDSDYLCNNYGAYNETVVTVRGRGFQ